MKILELWRCAVVKGRSTQDKFDRRTRNHDGQCKFFIVNQARGTFEPCFFYGNCCESPKRKVHYFFHLPV